MQIPPHAEVVPDPERLPFIAATRWQMHLFPAFRPDGAGTESPVRTFHTDTPAPHGMSRAGRGDARFLYYLFSVFYVNPFKERRPRGHTARLRAKADAKVAQKRRTAKKTGDFFGPEGESFRKNRQNGGREGNGAPCHMGPTRDGGRSGARRAHTARNIGKCEKGLHGARGHAGRKGGRKREGTAKGARRRRKRAAPGKPEGPDRRPARALPNRREAPTGAEREGKGKGEGKRAPPPALQR